MERGVAVITNADEWEKAARHLWGVSMADLHAFRGTSLTQATAEISKGSPPCFSVVPSDSSSGTSEASGG